MNPKTSRYYTFIRPIIKNRIFRSYSGLAFSFFTIMLFSVFALKPTISTILVLQKDLQEQQSVLSALDQKTKNLSLGKENLNRIDPQVRAKLDNLLPDKTDPISLLTMLNNLGLQSQASISGLQIQSADLTFNPIKLNKSPKLIEVPFTFNVSGNYSQITQLLANLDKSNRLVLIDSVNLNQDQAGKLFMLVNAKTYYLKN